MSCWDYGCTREFKSREVAQPQKNNVISGLIGCLVLNTLIFIDASATRRLKWYTIHARVIFCHQNTLRDIWLVYSSAYRNLHNWTSTLHVNNQCRKPYWPQPTARGRKKLCVKWDLSKECVITWIGVCATSLLLNSLGCTQNICPISNCHCSVASGVESCTVMGTAVIPR